MLEAAGSETPGCACAELLLSAVAPGFDTTDDRVDTGMLFRRIYDHAD